MPEAPSYLTYPASTSSDQLNGGASFNTTTNTWVPGTGAVTLAGTAATRDPGNPYECALPLTGTAGFVDTTYTLTAAQIQAGSLMGA